MGGNRHNFSTNETSGDGEPPGAHPADLAFPPPLWRFRPYIATSSMVQVALDAAVSLAAEGISAEVLDPRTLVPLDEQTLTRSAEKTGRVIVIDEGWTSVGLPAEICARISEQAFFMAGTIEEVRERAKKN